MRIYVTRDLVIRDPVSHRLVGPEGIDVSPNDLFWQRRLMDGDATIMRPRNSARTKPAKETE